MSRTAEEYNEEFEADRQEAREGNVVKFNVSEEDLGRQIRTLTEQAQQLEGERASVNDRMKSIYEQIDALKLDRGEFKAGMKLLKKDDIHRDKAQRTRRAFLRAHGLPEQVDMFYDPQESAEQELDLEDDDDPMTAIREAWAEDEADLDGEDDDILSRAGVATVQGDD